MWWKPWRRRRPNASPSPRCCPTVRADPLEADALSILLDLADAAHLQISKAPLENAGLVLRERKLRPLLRKVRIDAQEKAAALIWIAVLERLNFDMTVEREAARWGDSTK